VSGIFYFADGGGEDVGTPQALVRWIRTQSPDLIVYGGDVYNSGTDAQFARFFEELGHDVSNVCETAGNHDWDSPSRHQHPDRIPLPYERFWSRFPPPLSAQPIDSSKRGGARYDHVKDFGDWRLIFLDTGPCNHESWPVRDETRVTWLKERLTERGSRANIVFAHHSRLSRGKHGNNKTVTRLWETLFDDAGSPLAVLTVGGHDHNVSWYDPRPKLDPGDHVVDIAQGIYVHVNGAGGHGHDEMNNRLLEALRLVRGAKPQFGDDDNWCVTRVDLVGPRSVDVSVLSFGREDPPMVAEPSLLRKFEVRF